MTTSAPSERTISTFCVEHTPVTCAPIDLASCTANVPTPLEAPLISTRWPARTGLPKRSACRAVMPEVGRQAASSQLTVAGFLTMFFAATLKYSAKAPQVVSVVPNTSSPAANLAKPGPTSSTTPEKSMPGISFNPISLVRYGRPVSMWWSPA